MEPAELAALVRKFEASAVEEDRETARFIRLLLNHMDLRPKVIADLTDLLQRMRQVIIRG